MKDIILVLLCLSIAGIPASAQSHDKLADLRQEIVARIAASNSEAVGVAIYDTATHRSILINEKLEFHAASTMKVPVMMELFRMAAGRQINLTDKLVVRNQFKSIVDGSRFELDPAVDGDNVVYKSIGSQLTIRELIERMITHSSNLATNILIETAGAKNVMKLMHKLGANDIQVRRGVEDNKAFRAGLNNTTTAYDLMLLFRVISEARFIPKSYCDEMLGILRQQHYNEGIPALLPGEAKVAHKTGSITKIYHDAGIVYPPGRSPYIIVVLTRGLEQESAAHSLVAGISLIAYKGMIKE